MEIKGPKIMKFPQIHEFINLNKTYAVQDAPVGHAVIIFMGSE
jgi:hypothetical protein